MRLGIRHVVIFLAAAALLAWLGWRWAASQSENAVAHATAPHFVSTGETSNSGVIGRLWVDSARVYQDQTIRIDLVFENHSDRRIEDLRFLDFRTPGFGQAGDCWRDNHPACLFGQAQSASIPAGLDAGAAMHVWALLRPSVSSGKFGVLAVYDFAGRAPATSKLSASRQHFTQALLLQPLEVTTRWLELIGNLSSALALPVLTGLVLFGVKVWDKRREAHKESLEKERERTFAVWNEQLKRLFEYTQTHYLPIAQAIWLLNDSVAKLRGSATRAADPQYAVRALHHFVTCILQMRILSMKRGGFFLSSSVAEKVASRCSLLFAAERRKRICDEDVQAAADAMKKPMSLPAFRKLFASGQPTASLFSSLETEFLAWVKGENPHNDGGDSFDRAVSLLNVMALVLQFERDRPFYGYWYEGRQEPIDEELDKLMGSFPSEPADRINDLKRLIGRYQDELRGGAKWHGNQ